MLRIDYGDPGVRCVELKPSEQTLNECCEDGDTGRVSIIEMDFVLGHEGIEPSGDILFGSRGRGGGKLGVHRLPERCTFIGGELLVDKGLRYGGDRFRKTVRKGSLGFRGNVRLQVECQMEGLEG